MKNFFKKFAYNFQSWMRSRYGMDSFSMVLIALAFILLLVAKFTSISYIATIAMLICLYALFRSYSGNIEKRRKEYLWFQKLIRSPKNSFIILKNKKKDPDHLYIKCPKCKTILRVPKNKGKIIITCPNCQNRTETKS